jgi:hypothetical protein
MFNSTWVLVGTATKYDTVAISGLSAYRCMRMTFVVMMMENRFLGCVGRTGCCRSAIGAQNTRLTMMWSALKFKILWAAWAIVL